MDVATSDSVLALHAERSGDGQSADLVYAVKCRVGALQPDDRMCRAVGSAPGSHFNGFAIVRRRARACPGRTATITRVEMDEPPVPDQIPQRLVVLGATRCIDEWQPFRLPCMHVAAENEPECGAHFFGTHPPDEIRAFLVALCRCLTPKIVGDQFHLAAGMGKSAHFQ